MGPVAFQAATRAMRINETLLEYLEEQASGPCADAQGRVTQRQAPQFDEPGGFLHPHPSFHSFFQTIELKLNEVNWRSVA